MSTTQSKTRSLFTNLSLSKYFLWTCLFLLIILRFATSQKSYADGQKIRITAKVSGEPTVYDDQQQIKIAGFRAYLPLYPKVHYGDKVVIEGTVKNDLISRAKLTSLTQNNNLLLHFRQSIITFYEKSLPEPHSALVAGIVLGSKSSLPEGFWQALRNTGTAHVVVASGMNVTMLAGFVMLVLVNFIKRQRAALISIVIIWLYCFISGFDAPIVRASIMGSISFAALALGRLNQAKFALLISAGLMLVVNPLWLTDLGFILSFAATGSLILFESKVSSKLSFVPNIIRQDLSTTIAAQIGVAPILIFAFGFINIFSPLINAAILWTVAPIMIIGLVAGLVGVVFAPLGTLILYLCYPLTWFFVTVVSTLG